MRLAGLIATFVCISVYGVLALAPAAAATWTVPGDADTIQEAIDLASYGDTVHVLCGTYTQHDIILKSGIVLQSETGLADCVTIDAADSGRVMFGEHLDETTVVEGFTLINGLAQGSHPEDHGGGIRLLYSDLTIRNCVISNCTATSGGTTGTGGGIEMEHSSPLLENLVILDNYAQQHGGGISIYYADSTPTLLGCEIIGNSTLNSTQSGGGGVFISNEAAPTITACLIEGNEAGNGAGVWAYEEATPTIEFCTVNYNVITTPQGHGAGVYFASASGELSYCVVARNVGSAGGGIGVYGTGASPVISNCTVVYNTVNDVGGGIRVNESATPTIANTIIAFNNEEGIACYGGGTPTLSCCDLYGNSGGDALCGIDNGDNFSADPVFCDPDNDDYHLRCNSPCSADNSPGECGLVGALDVLCDVPRSWYVIADGSGDATTIQGGIDLACEGDTVVVACDVYHEHDIALKSGVILMSETGEPDCVTINGDSISRVFVGENLVSTTTVVGFTIAGGYAHGEEPGAKGNKGGGMRCWDSELLVSNCDFIENAAHAGGGLCIGGSGSDPIIQDCRFLGNSAEFAGGGISCGNGAYGEFEGCVITGNYAVDWGGGIQFGYLRPREIRSCTISGNSAGDQGGGIYVDYDANIDVATSIVWGNCAGSEGDEVYLWEDGSIPGTIHFTCSNVNSLGVEGLGDATYLEGNVFTDPLFCDPLDCGSAPTTMGDYHLSSDSPGLYAECGLMGALGHGCLGEAPHILEITDVGNDQGGWVRVKWERSRYDAEGEPVIVEYTIYRRQDEYAAGLSGRSPSSGYAAAADCQIDGWEQVAGPFEARGDSIYQGLAPTLCDSTLVGGMCESTFFVSARTVDPLVYFDSPAASGYSIDNLAPDVPQNLRIESPLLSWDEAEEEDFDYFTIYGSDDEEWDGTAVFIAHSVEPTYDLNGSAEIFEYYFVTATDFSGNEGLPGTERTVDVQPQVGRDHDIVLYPSMPNPMVRTTEFRFYLPAETNVELTVYNAAGRRVSEVVSGSMAPGQHRIAWDARGSHGNRVSPGVYFARFRAGSYQSTDRLVVLR